MGLAGHGRIGLISGSWCRMTDIQKARRKVKELIARATKERDRQGYRENLGYEQRSTLLDYLFGLNLTYLQKSQTLRSFDGQRDNL